MGLCDYHRKRDFERTPEPSGCKSGRTAGRSFVVQKHAASRLHYDFRLEFDGVLKSWAVPKGPSLDPTAKTLAVQVEDHPLEYAGFEGVIPKGQYGGGTVMVWDQGHWDSVDDPALGLKRGHLKFVLYGQKLQGAWSLVRMADSKSSDRPNWLLIKSRDSSAKSANDYKVTEAAPASVVSGRTLEAIAADGDRVWTSAGERKSAVTSRTSEVTTRPRRKSGSFARRSMPPGSKKAPLPESFAPQLATLTQAIPEGDEWLHEVKFDGYRILCFCEGNSVRLLTRRGNDWTNKFPDIVAAAQKLNLTGTLLDGELVALDANGVSSFQRLQNWMKHSSGSQLSYFVFDAPYFAGFDVQQSPLIDRKALIADFLLQVSPRNEGLIRYSDHVLGRGPEVLEQACQGGLEGVVSKRADSPYENRRSRHWLKSKCHQRQEFVIGGYTRPRGAREEFGALLVGYRDQDRWVYCGRVGTGFDDITLRDLSQKLSRLQRKTSPFESMPKGTSLRGVTWVEPRLVAKVRFAEWTDEGLLRHPTYQGFRGDKSSREVVKEMTKPTKSKTADRGARSKSRSKSAVIMGVKLSSPARVLFPEESITKQQLAEYYVAVADRILPHIVERPLTLLRCPQGRTKQCFIQRHWNATLPEDVESVRIRDHKTDEPYIVIHDSQGLVSLVQINVLELHPWGARVDQIERPDVLVFDLDPGPDVGWGSVKECAEEVRDELQAAGLVSFLRTSGGKGLHIVAPITRRTSWDDAAEFARLVAVGMAQRFTKKYVANMRKDVRQGRIFIDYVRNRRTATAIASYSTRAREGAPVATPISWDELAQLKGPDQFTLANVPARLNTLKTEPWPDYNDLRQSITREAWKWVRRR